MVTMSMIRPSALVRDRFGIGADSGCGIAGGDQRGEAAAADVQIFGQGAFGAGEDGHGANSLGAAWAQSNWRMMTKQAQRGGGLWLAAAAIAGLAARRAAVAETRADPARAGAHADQSGARHDQPGRGRRRCSGRWRCHWRRVWCASAGAGAGNWRAGSGSATWRRCCCSIGAIIIGTSRPTGWPGSGGCICVHHIDRDMDASTALRFHAIDMGVSVPLRLAQVRLFGVSPRALELWEGLFFASVLFHHADLEVPFDAPLAWLLTTPGMHDIHHRADAASLDSNFSAGLSVWDRLHGTFGDSAPVVPIGVPGVGATGLRAALRLELPPERHDAKAGALWQDAGEMR